MTKSEDCPIKPNDAAPPTEGPQTTVPMEEQPNCNFDEELCNWILEDSTWKWTRSEFLN